MKDETPISVTISDGIHTLQYKGIAYGHSHSLCTPQCACYPECKQS